MEPKIKTSSVHPLPPFKRHKAHTRAEKRPGEPSVQLSSNPVPRVHRKKPVNKQLQRLQSTRQVVKLAKEIDFKKPLPAPTLQNLDELASTIDTLVQCVEYTKKKVDDASIEALTRPGHEHPDWQAFARKVKAELPKRRTQEEQNKVAQARQAEDQKDKELSLVDRMEKYIQEATDAKRKKEAHQEATSKREILTAGLDAGGDPDLERAELKLSDEERKLAPLLSSVRQAFEYSNKLMLLLTPDTPNAQKLSNTLTALLRNQQDDATLHSASPSELAAQALSQPFTRLPLLAKEFKGQLAAQVAAQRDIEATRAEGGEPTAEQLEHARKAQRMLRACAQEIIKVHEGTLDRLCTVGRLFVNLKGLPLDQLEAVHGYGKALLNYTAMLALPSSALMHLTRLAHSLVRTDETAAAPVSASQEVSGVAPASAAPAAAQSLPRSSNPVPVGKSADKATALVVRSGLQASSLQGSGGRITRVLPPPPIQRTASVTVNT
jgi:hypothetical protein